MQGMPFSRQGRPEMIRDSHKYLAPDIPRKESFGDEVDLSSRLV